MATYVKRTPLCRLKGFNLSNILFPGNYTLLTTCLQIFCSISDKESKESLNFFVLGLVLVIICVLFAL